MDPLEAVRPVSTLIPALPLAVLATPEGTTRAEPDTPGETTTVRADATGPGRPRAGELVPVTSPPVAPPSRVASAAEPTAGADEPARPAPPSRLDPTIAPLLGSVLIAAPTAEGPAFSSVALLEPGNAAVPAPRRSADPSPSEPMGPSAPVDADGVRPMTMRASSTSGTVQADSLGGPSTGGDAMSHNSGGGDDGEPSGGGDDGEPSGGGDDGEPSGGGDDDSEDDGDDDDSEDDGDDDSEDDDEPGDGGGPGGGGPGDDGGGGPGGGGPGGGGPGDDGGGGPGGGGPGDDGGGGDPGGDDDDGDDGDDSEDVVELPISGGWGGPSSDLVPVGAIMSFSIDTAQLPHPVESWEWEGGTDYASYFSDAATKQAKPSMSVKKDVKKDGESYSFIVDPVPRTYTITVKATFTQESGGGTGRGEVSFESVRPDVTFTDHDQGTSSLFEKPGVSAQIRLIDKDEVDPNDEFFNWPKSAGMHITARVETHDFGGEFMYLQLMVPQRYTMREVTYPTGAKERRYYRQISSAGPAIDNSFSFTDRDDNVHQYNYGAYGYPLVNQDQDVDESDLDRTDQNGWTMDKNAVETHSMGDQPMTPPTSPDARILQVGNVSAGGIPERFATYVMYKPENGVWVALARVSWEWGGKAERSAATNWQWQEVAYPGQLNPPVPLNALGVEHKDEFFPAWGNTTLRILNSGQAMIRDTGLPLKGWYFYKKEPVN